MATSPLSRVVHHLRQTTVPADGGERTDGELMDTFRTCRDEIAFEALVRRHGRMVLGVCQRVLGHAQDAEDAFQATFLVLARKAHAVHPPDRVGNWLHGVALRTAMEARSLNARRRSRETVVADPPDRPVPTSEPGLDLRPVLDQEVARLPERYRVAVVLCELEGRSRKDVARQLAIPEGTLSSRLAEARRRLASRLVGRGLALSEAALAAVLIQSLAPVSVPGSLFVSTVQAATLVATGQAAAATLVSLEVAALTRGVLTAMFLTRLKLTAVVMLALGVAGAAVGVVAHSARADAPKVGAADGAKPRGKRDGEGGKKPGTGETGKPAARATVTISGVVSKLDLQRKRDDGTAFTLTRYILTEASGNKVALPAPRVRESGEKIDKYDLNAFLGKEVTATVVAYTAAAREGAGPNDPKRVVRVLAINSIELKKK